MMGIVELTLDLNDRRGRPCALSDVLRNLTFYREPPLPAALDAALGCRLPGASFEARVRPMDAATRRCSSGVSWKM
jgi:hypothetical protein